MGFQRVTKTEILNHCILRKLLIHERDTRLNDQLDKPRLRLHAFQHQKVYWSDRLTFAVWGLAPNDHLKQFVFISLRSLDINVTYVIWKNFHKERNTEWYRLIHFTLSCRFFFLLVCYFIPICDRYQCKNSNWSKSKAHCFLKEYCRILN